jgi:hypothetical protein
MRHFTSFVLLMTHLSWFHQFGHIDLSIHPGYLQQVRFVKLFSRQNCNYCMKYAMF